VQGLLEAMKDYQWMAPDQLSNDNLISILWNKVPFKLQKEVGEIKDWSLQELLQRLLRAESRVEERDHHTNQAVPKRRWVPADSDDSKQTNKAAAEERTGKWEKIINKMQIKVMQKLNLRMLHFLNVTRKVMWLVSDQRKPKMNPQG